MWSVRLDSEAAARALAPAPHTDRDLAEFAPAPDPGNRLLRRRLTRALLARIADVAPASILFGRTAQGAPSMLSPKGWYLSVGGQAPLCLIGVAREPVGVDVEPLDDAPPLWDMLTFAEADSLRLLPTSARPLEWLRRWTAKEAHAKRLGYASGADPAGIETRPVGFGQMRARSAEGDSLCRIRENGGRVETIALAG